MDQILVKRLVPDALGGLLGDLPALPSQEAILLGWAVPTPVRVCVRDLEESQRPCSDDPKFWATWLHQKGIEPNWPEIASEWEQVNKKESSAESKESTDTVTE